MQPSDSDSANLRITKYIAVLEESLGVIIFVRDHHVVSVTDAGRAYVEHARVAVLHADRAVQAARAADHNAELILNIGRSPYADPFFTSTLLTMRLPLFPRMRLNLVSGFSCDLAHDVLAGELDAAVLIEPPETAKLTGGENRRKSALLGDAPRRPAREATVFEA